MRVRNFKISRVVGILLAVVFLVAVIGIGLIVSDSGKVVAASKKATKGEIAFVPPGMVSPFYAGTISGAKPMAEKLGYKFTVLAPERESDFAGQVKIVEDLVTKKVKGIALCAINADAIAAAVRKANEAKIPVVVFNSLTELPKCKVEAYVGYNQREGGKKVADYIAKVKKGKAKVAIIEGLPGYHTREREGGFMDQIKKKYPGIKVVAVQPGDWEREKSMNAAMNMLQAHPDIEVFYGLSDEMALGAAQACKAAGRKDILTIGIDGNPNALEAITKGELTATLYVYPDVIGAKAIEALDKVIRGQKVNKFIVTPTVIVDKTNVDKFLKKK
ncbi:sugar ABC transporter substrate-binding protein [Caldicellulosiruptor acetigenus]|uniref:sugar ABC transporter substrate-binding protein n=1 Tax=Caldicellulosiruptor acetigenus TaxID=301953 RepID=UPI00041F9EE5|nr:sugar ABC transporter substrate-binding protein [Caldicellulosiruptor acetigenus]WAM36167.1 sugar ABC transporter substrate-binding protein [Caldicellulosiruptor acetigenus]